MTPARLSLLLVVMIAVICGLLYLAHARAHGDAAWIMANPATRHCCGPRDCEPVSGRVRQNADTSWSVAGISGALMLGNPGLYFRRTPDSQPWACRNVANNTLRCLFLPFPDI